MKNNNSTLPELFENDNFFCPLCQAYFPESEYLKKVIENKKTLWLANMVTHYRHNHIKSWNRCWDSYSGNYYRRGWFSDYDNEKSLVNERAKRQIIRKCTEYLIQYQITVEHFLGFEYNENKTIELAKIKLP